jgi:phosphoribosylformimino-5-aminoimidazole carboxamide ribotide isomerase
MGLQIGGGVDSDNARKYLDAGASAVIVTSYIFDGGNICFDALKKISEITTPARLCVDLSCRKRDGKYFVVTDRWQTFTNSEISPQLFEELSAYCGEFLVHAVDVEGKMSGVDEKLIGLLAETDGAAVTYAGGIHSIADIEIIKKRGRGRVDFTVGSALDIFGGNLSYKTIAKESRLGYNDRRTVITKN